MQAMLNTVAGEHSVGESPATTQPLVRILEGPAVFSAPSKPNNPKKFRDSKPKTPQICFRCDNPATVHGYCVDWCNRCWTSPPVYTPYTPKPRIAEAPCAPKPKLKKIIIKKKPVNCGITGVSYEHGVCAESGCRRLTLLWNCGDAELDASMTKEYNPSFADRLNMMWVETIKTTCGWKNGEKIYAMLKKNGDGYFDVWYSKNKAEIECCDMIVEPSGYVCRSYFNQYSLDEDKNDGIAYQIYIRTACNYNDCISYINTAIINARKLVVNACIGCGNPDVKYFSCGGTEGCNMCEECWT